MRTSRLWWVFRGWPGTLRSCSPPPCVSSCPKLLLRSSDGPRSLRLRRMAPPCLIAKEWEVATEGAPADRGAGPCWASALTGDSLMGISAR